MFVQALMQVTGRGAQRREHGPCDVGLSARC
jgi:hypothetical protein